MAGRVSQEVIEVSEIGVPNARASQVVSEVEASGSPNARATQVVSEVEASGSPSARASQVVSEVSASGSPIARVSQIVVEILIRSIPVSQPPMYPVLPGLSYDTFWNMNFFNLNEKTATGAELNLAIASEPIYEFDLTYNFLRGWFGPNSTEFMTYFGFWRAMGGQAGRFLFHNEKDYKVTNQIIATTDGTSSVYGPIVRTIGFGPYSGTDAVGYVDVTSQINVYLDGVLQDPTSYSIITTTPVNQQLKFNDTPSADQVITMDFQFFYYCKFVDDTVSFEQFIKDLWSLQKLTIRSCRAGT